MLYDTLPHLSKTTFSLSQRVSFLLIPAHGVCCTEQDDSKHGPKKRQLLDGLPEPIVVNGLSYPYKVAKIEKRYLFVFFWFTPMTYDISDGVILVPKGL